MNSDLWSSGYIISQQCLLDALFEIKAQRNAKCKSRGIFCIKWHIGSFGRLMKGTWARYLGPKWKAWWTWQRIRIEGACLTNLYTGLCCPSKSRLSLSSSRIWHHGLWHHFVRACWSFWSILVRPSQCIRVVGIQCTSFGDMACCTDLMETMERFSRVDGFSEVRQSYKLFASVACFIGIFIPHLKLGWLWSNSEMW